MRASVVLAIVTVMSASNSVTAADYQHSGDDFYLGLTVGYGFINDISASSSITVGTLALSATATASFHGGPAFTGSIGYWVSPQIAIEGQLGYGRFGYDQISGTVTASSGGTTVTATGSIGVDGDLDIFTGLANVIVSPWDGQTIAPFAGAGIGLAVIDDKVRSVAGNTTIAYSETFANFATTAIVGLDAQLTERVAVGGRYQFYWLNTSNAFGPDATAHTFNLRGKVSF